MQIGGCLPGHFARAHGGGNSSNSLSKDLDRVRRHWQGPCWVAVVVVDAEVWELKLPRSIMPLWEGCPAVDGLYGCCRCARARVRRAVPQCTACDKAALERLSLGSGCTSRLQGLPSPRGLGEWLARRIRRGAALRSRELERTRWSSESRRYAPTTLLRLKETSQSVRRYL